MAEQAEVVNNSGVSETPATDSTPADNNSPIVADDSSFDDGFGEGEDSSTPAEDAGIELDNDPDQEESSEEPVEEAKEESTEEQSNEDTQEEEKPLSKAEARKEQLNSEIRDLVSQRNQIRQQVEQANADAYKPATPDELTEQVNPETGEYYNRIEAQVEAMRQEREVEKYNNQVAESKLTLVSEAQKALTDFPLFDEQSPEYNAEIAEQAGAILSQSLIRDENTGQVIGSHISPYQLYQTVYSSAKASEARGKASGQKATEKMLSNADPSSGVTKSTAKPDVFMQGFESADY